MMCDGGISQGCSKAIINVFKYLYSIEHCSKKKIQQGMGQSVVHNYAHCPRHCPTIDIGGGPLLGDTLMTPVLGDANPNDTTGYVPSEPSLI